MTHFESLTSPSHLYTRAEVLSKPSPVPSASGVYAWFFKEIPEIVPTDGCVTKDGLTLLYVGISPKNESSSQNIRKRIKSHYQGNAEGSTLRLTLGVLLAGKSGFPLRRVGSGKRMTLTHVGEQWLDTWMQENALVCWIEHPDPCALRQTASPVDSECGHERQRAGGDNPARSSRLRIPPPANLRSVSAIRARPYPSLRERPWRVRSAGT